MSEAIPHVDSLTEYNPIQHDFDVALKAAISIIVRRAREVVFQKKTFRIFNISDRMGRENRQTNIQNITFFHGFWDKEARKHRCDVFEAAGVHTMLLEALNVVLGPKGYELKDVSDPALSFNHVLEVTLRPST